MREKKPGTWQLIVTMVRKQERLFDNLTKMDRLAQRIVARQQERRYETVHGTEAEARTRLEAMQAEADGAPSPDTMAGLMAEWMRSESYRWKPGPKVKYRGIVTHHVSPFIGERAVVSLKAKDIQSLYATLREQGRSETTIASVPQPANDCVRLRHRRTGITATQESMRSVEVG